jgi:hypothetical protein
VKHSDVAEALAEADRLYRLAGFVHDRAETGSDSAPLAYRAVLQLLRSLILIEGRRPPDDVERLTNDAVEVALGEGLCERDFSDDLAAIREAQERFWKLGVRSTIVDDRRYDRAFVRLGSAFADFKRHFNARLPSADRGLLKGWKSGVALAGALLAGVVIGMRVGAPERHEPAAVLMPAAPPPGAGPAIPKTGFLVTFFKDENLGDPVTTRLDPAISFDWGSDAPSELATGEHFSARWTGKLNVPETGKYEFFLTSDDGSRLFIDDKQVIDNWGSHAEVTREASLDLDAKVYPIRVEYFNGLGSSILRLEWSSDRFTRRIVGATDVR